jgi:hypothetical protein
LQLVAASISYGPRPPEKRTKPFPFSWIESAWLGRKTWIRSTIRNGLALLDRQDAVDARYRDFFAQAAGPSNFELIDFRGGPETKVQARIGG